MQSASLYPLVATGIMNVTYPVKYSAQLYTIPATTNVPHSIIRSCDAMVIDGIITASWPQLRDKGSLQLAIGGSVITRFPLRLIRADHVRTSGDRTLIRLPADAFMVKPAEGLKIQILNLQYHMVEISIIMPEASSIAFEFITEMQFYQTDIRREMLSTPELNIDIYQYREFPVSGPTTEFAPRLVSTGFYLCLPSPLIELELMLNNRRFLFMDASLIDFYELLVEKRELWTQGDSNRLHKHLSVSELPAEMINSVEGYLSNRYEYLYYVPFNRYKTANPDNLLACTINFSHIDQVKLNLRTEHGVYDGGQIWVKNINRLVITQGMGGMKFTE
jgi:hypothetical protein